MKKSVKILGTLYKLNLNIPYTKDPSLMGRFGYCDMAEKKIVVADIKTVPGWEEATEVGVEHAFNDTLRHEVIHAYLIESGLNGSANEVDCWARNEEMVDWIAIQFPKILKTFEELDCVGR